jgi:2TM domain
MENRDERLWQMARKRAGFKRHAFVYIVVNAFLWILWLITSGRHEQAGDRNSIPWPLWTTLGWGIGLAFNYFDAYHKAGNSLEEKEYDRLKRQQQQ